MKFTASAFVLLICTAALLSTTEGRPKRMHLRCECINTHSEPEIPFGRILSLKVIPAGPQCKHEEIIATMKKRKMCLDPAKDWVISLKEQFNEKSIKSQRDQRAAEETGSTMTVQGSYGHEKPGKVMEF